MKTYIRLFLMSILCITLISCDKESDPEEDYSYPAILTKLTENSSIEIHFKNQHIIKESDEEGYSFFSTTTDGNKVYTWAQLMLDFKDFDSLVPNEEIKPEGLFFALISSSNSGHSTSIIREGKVFYVGMKGESALLRWENVTFNVLPFPNVEGDTGKYVISGTMECPVYETREEWNKAFYESLGITDITSFDTNQ